MTAWNELPSGLQYGFRARAEYLLKHGYKHDVTLEELAEQIYNKEKHKIPDRIHQFVAGMIHS